MVREALILGGERGLATHTETQGTLASPTPQSKSDFPNTELGQLLGPLVSPLLQTSSGTLDLSKFPTNNFEDFRAFLITQVQVDGIAFNKVFLDSYAQILGQEKHETLLRKLYETAQQGQNSQSKTKILAPMSGTTQPNSRGEGASRDLLLSSGGVPRKPRGSVFLKKLQELTADLIGVSAERFAAHHLRSAQGRNRLARILQDSKNFTPEIRADLVKGIAQAARGFGTGRAAYRKLNAQISVWNYSNTSVTPDELNRATQIALGMLHEVEMFQGEDEGLFERYLKHPEQVTRFVGLEKELQGTLSNTAIQEKAKFVHFNQDRYDPQTVLAVKLDQLWLTLIDEERWQDSGSLKTAKNAAFLIKEIEGYRQQLNEVKSESELLKLTEQIRTLLKGGLGVTGEGTWRSIKDFTATNTVAKMFQDLPEVHRSTYDGLLQYLEEIHHANDMGEKLDLNLNETTPFDSDISQLPAFAKNSPTSLNLIPNRRKGSSSRPAGGELRPPTGGTKLASRAPGGLATLNQGGPANVIPAHYHPKQDQILHTQEIQNKTQELQDLDPKKFQEAKTQLIHGLKQTKRSLWYQYKQHKALSRSLSQIAKKFGSGDIVEIENGQEALSGLVTQAKQAQNPEQLKAVIQSLQGQLSEAGALHRAMVAAEMDGTEQLIGLGQTILIIMGTRQVGRGLARLSATFAETSAGQRVTQMAQNLRNLKLGQGIQRGIQNNVFAWRASKGFALGSWLATAENAVAAATDEVKGEGHHLEAWALDALATGLAMGTITTTASYMGRSMEQSLFKRMLGRYFGSARGPMRWAGDVMAETLEEVSDATIRGKLVDADHALGFDQFREIAMVSGLGGFTKTGMIAEMLRTNKKPQVQGEAEPFKKSAPTQALPIGLVLGVGMGGKFPIQKKPSTDSSPKGSIETVPPKKLGLFAETRIKGEVHGIHNPILQKAPWLYPLLHPRAFHKQWTQRLENYFLKPYKKGQQASGRDVALYLPRMMAHSVTRALLETLYLPMWPLGLLSQPLNIPAWMNAYQSHQKQLEVQKKQELLLQEAQQELEPNARLTDEDPKKSAWKLEQVEQVASDMGWDKELILAKSLELVSLKTLEYALDKVFRADAGKKIRFLHRFPLRNSEEVVKSYTKGHSLNLSFQSPEDLIRAAQILDQRQQGIGGLSLFNSVIHYPQEIFSDEARKRVIEYGLERLKQGVDPQHLGVLSRHFAETEATRALAIRYWGQSGQTQFLPDVLYALKTPQKPEVHLAALSALNHWLVPETLSYVQEFLRQGNLEPSLKITGEWLESRLLKKDLSIESIKKHLKYFGSAEQNQLDNRIWMGMGGTIIPWSRPNPDNTDHSIENAYQSAQALLRIGKEVNFPDTQAVGLRILMGLFLHLPKDLPLHQQVFKDLLDNPANPLENLLELFASGHAQPHRQDGTWLQADLIESTEAFLIGSLDNTDLNPGLRLKLAELVYPILRDSQVREVFDALLGDFHISHEAAKTLDRIAPDWDTGIKKGLEGDWPPTPNGPQDSGGNQGPGGHQSMMAAMPLGLSSLMGTPMEVPWWATALSIVGTGLLGMALSAKRPREASKTKGPIEDIRDSFQFFHRKLNSRQKKRALQQLDRFQMHLNESDSPINRILDTAKHYLVQGFDPSLELINTGATPAQILSLLSGHAKGEFPLTMALGMENDPAFLTRSLKVWGLNRKEPLLTLSLSIPMSQWLDWMGKDPNRLNGLDKNNGNFLKMPVTLLGEHIKEFGPRGFIKIFSPPRPKHDQKLEWQRLHEVLKAHHFDQSNLLLATGPDIHEINSWADTRKMRHLESWIDTIYPGVRPQWKAFVSAWVSLLEKEIGKYPGSENHFSKMEATWKKVHTAHSLPQPSAALKEITLQQYRKQRVQGPIPGGASSHLDSAQNILGYLVKDLEALDHREGIPRWAHISFAQNQGLDVHSWLAHNIKKGPSNATKAVEEALYILFHGNQPKTRSQLEIDFIQEHRLTSGLPILRHYLASGDVNTRILALKAIKRVSAQQEFSEMVDILEGLVDRTYFTKEHVEEFRQWYSLLEQLQIPPQYSQRCKNYLKGLRASSNIEISALAEAASLKLGFLDHPSDLYLEIVSPNPKLRKRAFLILSEFPLAEFTPYLLQGLNDADNSISGLAIEALGALGGKDAVDALSSILLRPEFKTHRKKIIQALSKIHSPYCLPELENFLKLHDVSPPQRHQAMALIANLNGKYHAGTLEKYLNHGDPRTRIHAAAALISLDLNLKAKKVFAEVMTMNPGKEGFYLALEVLPGMRLRAMRQALSQLKDKQSAFKDFLKNEGGPLGWKILDQLEPAWLNTALKNWQHFQTKLGGMARPFPLKTLGFIDPERRGRKLSFGLYLDHQQKVLLKQNGDLSQKGATAFAKIIDKAANGLLSPKQTLIELNKVLQTDWLETLQEHPDRSIEEYNFFEIMGQEGIHARALPHWLNSWLEDSEGKKQKFYQITLKGKKYQDLENLGDELELILTLHSQIGTNLLTLPLNFFDSNNGETRKLRLLPPALWMEAMERNFPDNPVGIQIHPSLSKDKQMRRLFGLRRFPMALSIHRRAAEGRGKLHPYTLALHDFYHWSLHSELSLESWRARQNLLELMEEWGLVKKAKVAVSALLDGLYSAEQDAYQEFFYDLADRRSLRCQEQEFRKKLEQKFLGHPHREAILEAFDKQFSKKSSSAAWGLMLGPTMGPALTELLTEYLPYTLAGAGLLLGAKALYGLWKSQSEPLFQQNFATSAASDSTSFMMEDDSERPTPALPPKMPQEKKTVPYAIPSHLTELIEGKVNTPDVSISLKPTKAPLTLNPREQLIVAYQLGWDLTELRLEDFWLFESIALQKCWEIYREDSESLEDFELLELVNRATEYFAEELPAPEDSP